MTASPVVTFTPLGVQPGSAGLRWPLRDWSADFPRKLVPDEPVPDNSLRRGDFGDSRPIGANGDGTIFRPGLPSRIGCHKRVAMDIADDYEYLALLAKLNGQAAAWEPAASIMKRARGWESRPDLFLRVRSDSGALLNPSPKCHPTGEGHAI